MRLAATALAALAAVACTNEKPHGASTAKPTAKPAEPGKLAGPKSDVVLPPAGVAPPAVAAGATVAGMWDLPIKTLRGQPMTLADYKGKAILVVNVASKCGLTPQYAALEALQEKYAAKGFTVLGFPCNQFGGQEPGSPEQIEEFCSSTYGVTFPMFSKISVKGKAIHPLYACLTDDKLHPGSGGAISWNFNKFLIGRDGAVLAHYGSRTAPDDPELAAAIEQALK